MAEIDQTCPCTGCTMYVLHHSFWNYSSTISIAGAKQNKPHLPCIHMQNIMTLYDYGWVGLKVQKLTIQGGSTSAQHKLVKITHTES